MKVEDIKLALQGHPHVKQVWVIGGEYYLVPKKGAELVKLDEPTVVVEEVKETKISKKSK